MSELRRRQNVVAKQPSSAAEADNDVTTPADDVIKPRDKCFDVMRGILVSLVCRLHHPVDGSSLAVFRAVFGKYV